MMENDQGSICFALEKALADESVAPINLPFFVLMIITQDFSDNQLIGSGGFGSVYKGLLRNGIVAVKKLHDNMFFDVQEKDFLHEVDCLIKMKHRNIVRFLGYSYETHHILYPHQGSNVLAGKRNMLFCFEFLSKGSLANYVTGPSSGLEWGLRYQIIKGICEGVGYLHQQQRITHMDLKSDNILLDDSMVPKIADFGLSRRFNANQSKTITKNTVGSMGYMAPEFLNGGTITFKADIYSLGVIIIEILMGCKECPNVDKVLESWTTNTTSKSSQLLEQVKVCAEIGIECRQEDSSRRPDIQDIICRLNETDISEQVPSYEMPGIPKHEAPPPPQPQNPLSPMGEACSRMDLTAIHQILLNTHYRDDEGSNELLFTEWTQQMRDMLEARKRGDFAFRDKDFKAAIACYTQFVDVGTMVSPTVYARRSLCHLMCDQHDAALRDAMQAQIVYRDWPTALYMQAVALSKLNMQTDATDILNEALQFEQKWQKNTGITKHEEAPPPPQPQNPLSPMGEACSRMDLTAIHQILLNTQYRDGEGSNELSVKKLILQPSFKKWTQQMRDMLARKRGDYAFRHKDFKAAIDCYTQFLDVGTMVSPAVYARRSLCHLMCDQPDAALRDALQAQMVCPDWPTALYMQAVALSKLNMQNDATDMLNEASQLEQNWQKNTKL